MEKFDTQPTLMELTMNFLFSLKKLNYNNRLQKYKEISFVVGCAFVFLRVLKRTKTEKEGN